MKKLLSVGMLCMLMSLTTSVFAQSVSGNVTDSDGIALIGATVLEKGTDNGTITDVNGDFALNVSSIPSMLEISYTGYATMSVDVSSEGKMMIQLSEGTTLDEVVVTGSRGKARTILGSPVPIDNINAAALKESGQGTVDQMLNYKVPSYNSSNQTVSDATAHFDPGELRNLGPSRTLVLVNGKRKNQSALVYVNDTPGKGEVGTDMKAVPVESIERIEVLRDGAAAQYGSDAIAGVINIVTKKRTDGEVSLSTGGTAEGDGINYEAGINKGFKIGDGYINLTGKYYHQDLTNRAGEPGKDDLFGVDGTNPFIVANPDLGMTIGQPEYDMISVFANLGLPYGDGKGEFYGFGGHTYRNGKSFALYRTPYWITDDFGLLTPAGEAYDGFQPTFETTVDDVSATLGNKYNFSGWNSDLSVTFGSNSANYLIGNSINPALGASSPTEFDPGGYTFDHIVGNLDLNKTIDQLTVSFGAEGRKENFEVRAGQVESYDQGGVQSFPGLQPGNALDESRTNVGVYGGLDYDLSDNTLIGGAVRFENYSDFGSNVSWKINGRQFLGDKKGAIRASLSTGFRAPSLHQIYLSNIQTLVSGGTISNQGTFNNVSDEVKSLGIPALDAEKSLNITGGFTYKLTDEFSFSADYYNVSVKDRVLFTGEIGFDGDDTTTNPVEQVLIDNSVTSIKYFVNALDTRTQGVDIVADYNTSKFGAVLSVNLNETMISNDQDSNGDYIITSPGVVGAEGYEIFNRKEQARITDARPKVKVLLGLNYKLDKFRVGLNNTYFGSVKWQHAVDPEKDQTFAGKVITDLLLGYAFNDDFGINFTVNNLLNVYPDVIDTKGDVVTDLGGRFQYPWEVNQFGFLGTTVKVGLSYKF